jgi:hypothetical protein
MSDLLRDKIARIIANDPYPLQGHYDRADRVMAVLAEDAGEEAALGLLERVTVHHKALAVDMVNRVGALIRLVELARLTDERLHPRFRFLAFGNRDARHIGLQAVRDEPFALRYLAIDGR